MGILVGLVGFADCGKGTFGDFLKDNHNFAEDSFAASLKDAVSTIFGWPRELLEGDTKESRFWREQADRYWSEKLDIKNFTPRMAMQLLGTEGCREIFNNDIWLATVEKRWIDRGKPNTVIKDCRFPNEIKMVRSNGGHVIRIKRGPEPHFYNMMYFFNKGMADEEDIKQIRQMRTTKSIPHESETAWIGCDFDSKIENEGDLAELEHKTAEFVNKIGGDIQHTLGL